ncbi:hypothetical protein CG740_35245 [Streptomyces sp. CB01201]|uniref:GNAT family N-acetyltransferase n=1 Tax=Streptomyces sp. CB01201 TaxID=2020324 RepID=UPI000C28004C|nr:GNAT family protein [Streptomyces sp. CB01201]PJM98546.1 hypothetical protein CG740_35245 [Streptomyces sp. CB01201]
MWAITFGPLAWGLVASPTMVLRVSTGHHDPARDGTSREIRIHLALSLRCRHWAAVMAQAMIRAWLRRPRCLRGLGTPAPSKGVCPSVPLAPRASPARGQQRSVASGPHRHRQEAVVRFTLAPRRHGHGYATEAVRGMLHHLFARGLHRASADCDARDSASVRVLEQVGFHRDGQTTDPLGPQYSRAIDTGPDDTLVFSMTASQWRQHGS